MIIYLKCYLNMFFVFYYRVKQLNGMRVCLQTKTKYQIQIIVLFDFDDGKAIAIALSLSLSYISRSVSYQFIAGNV